MLLEPELLHGEACIDPLDPSYLIDVRTGRRLRRARGADDWPSSGMRLAGKLGIATAQSTSSTSYTLLATPDRIPNVFLPQDGLIVVAYQALWQHTVANNARAAIFIGANQQKIVPSGGGAPGVIEAVGPSGVNSDGGLATTPIGLQANSNSSGTTEVTTGQVISPSSGLSIGGPAWIFAAAGTYDVSIQYKNSAAGTLTAKNRHLWVWVIG